MTGETEFIDPEEIVPPHPAFRDLRWLVADMVENGWQGRPLLVIDTGDEYVAWSGSHRISAAIEAGLEAVPCYVIPESTIVSATDGAVDAKNGHVMDYERLEILIRVGDEAGIEIMRQEL